MWFKNLRVYRFTQQFVWNEAANISLQERRFFPCQRSEPSSTGWVPVLGQEDAPLVHQIGHFILLCLKKEQKVLPASAVNVELDLRKELYQNEHARPMPRKEQQSLKEDITQQLLPQALSKYGVTWAVIDLAGQRLWVDSASAAKAEELTAVLRSCLGSLPIKPWGAEYPGHHFFTEWVAQQKLPESFSMGLDAELRGERDDDSVVRFKNHDLTTAEISLHLQHGKQVTQLALDWNERLNFTLTDDYSIKKLRFSDILHEELADVHVETRAEQLDRDFALMSAECNQLLNQLEQALEINTTVEP